jgi:hypothetical protein
MPQMYELGSLRALEPIETLETVETAAPMQISLVPEQRCGSAQQPEELMAMRVKWANTARYKVLTRNVPQQFAPYNAIIRIIGTEDFRTDYLAMFVD